MHASVPKENANKQWEDQTQVPEDGTQGAKSFT